MKKSLKRREVVSPTPAIIAAAYDEKGNDGLRPVIMKLEATDEESKIDYHPIERKPNANDNPKTRRE